MIKNIFIFNIIYKECDEKITFFLKKKKLFLLILIILLIIFLNINYKNDIKIFYLYKYYINK